MLIGKETRIGPALRVLRHFTERERFYQLKFQSGERALLLAAGMPAPSVERTAGSRRLSPVAKGLGIQSDPSRMLFLSATRGEIQISQSLLIVGGALVFGIASATARERSESILAPVLLHWLCTAALLLSSHLPF